MNESNESYPISENGADISDQIGLYIGRVGTTKMIEVEDAKEVMVKEGFVGLPVSLMHKIINESTSDSVIWVKAPNASASAEQNDQKTMEFVNGEVVIYPDKQNIQVNGTNIDLQRREFQILEYFAKKSGRIVYREELIHAIWGGYIQARTPDVNVSNIRKKLGNHSWILRTIFKVGYIFDDSPEKNPNYVKK